MRPILILAALLIAAATISCTPTNEEALARMTADQRSYLSNRVEAVRYGMSERQVTQILGAPVRGKGTPRVCYQPPGEKGRSELCIRFELFKARYVEWFEPGEEGFRYSVDLKAPKAD